ncbi:hypothetical protein [Micromonospora sp. NPDC005806]|uniref:hypothetical protein n=1 Tax=Micromonospora sp. NPDC005806 TaxID=3364234 RepID=UPI0036A06AB8
MTAGPASTPAGPEFSQEEMARRTAGTATRPRPRVSLHQTAAGLLLLRALVTIQGRPRLELQSG